jgi:hypothetical protein
MIDYKGNATRAGLIMTAKLGTGSKGEISEYIPL